MRILYNNKGKYLQQINKLSEILVKSTRYTKIGKCIPAKKVESKNCNYSKKL